MIIKQLIELARENPDICVLWLYGSRAKGNPHLESDYDLAIAFKSFLTDPWSAQMRPQTLAIDWALALNLSTEQLSIVDIQLIPLALEWEVIHDGKVLLAKDKLRLIQEESRIARQYELDLLYHRKLYGT
jgi:predicted nucleotidyltransferase